MMVVREFCIFFPLTTTNDERSVCFEFGAVYGIFLFMFCVVANPSNPQREMTCFADV